MEGQQPSAVGESTPIPTEHTEAIHTYFPAMGAGVNLAETETFGVCVVADTVRDNHGFDNRLYNERLVKTRRELNDTMDISASVSARGLFFSGSAEASFFKNVDFQSDSVYWLVDSKYVLGQETLDLGRVRLSDAAERLLARGDGYAAFTRACGDRFYSGVQKGARYSLLYDFHGEEKKTLESIRARANGSGFGISASAEFNQLVAAASDAHYLSIHSHIQGGGSGIAEHARDAAHLRHQLQSLRSDVLDHGRGVNLRWYASNYEMFPLFQEAKARANAEANASPGIDELHRENVLGDLYVMYSENRSAIRDVQQLHQRTRGSNSIFLLSESDHAKGLDMIEALNGQNHRIARLSRQCLAAAHSSDCTSEGLTSLLGPSDDSWRGTGRYSPDEGFGKWSMEFVTDPRVQPNRHSLTLLRNARDSPDGTFLGATVPLYDVFGSQTLNTGDYEIRALVSVGGQTLERVIGIDGVTRVPGTRRRLSTICRGRYERACSIHIFEEGGRVKVRLTVLDDDGFPYPNPFVFESED